VTTRLTAFFLWGVVIAAMVVPIALATTSPYLAYRGPLYIAAGFAGIVAMSLFVLQPLLACPVRALIAPATARRWHRIIGASILILILAHVVGLYFVSPPRHDRRLVAARANMVFAVWRCDTLGGGPDGTACNDAPEITHASPFLETSASKHRQHCCDRHSPPCDSDRRRYGGDVQDPFGRHNCGRNGVCSAALPVTMKQSHYYGAKYSFA
jgi:hypothetical protein